MKCTCPQPLRVGRFCDLCGGELEPLIVKKAPAKGDKKGFEKPKKKP